MTYKKLFIDYLNSIDDQLFVDICEAIGSQEITRLSQDLDSGDLHKVLNAIADFTTYAEDYLNTTINYYKLCLTNLPK